MNAAIQNITMFQHLEHTINLITDGLFQTPLLTTDYPGLWENLWNPSTLAKAAVGVESTGFVEGFATAPTVEPVVDKISRLLLVASAR